MDLGLKGKAAIVTGASRGIGRAIALRLADEGAGVAICARGEPALREVEAELRAGPSHSMRRCATWATPAALDGFLDAARAKLEAGATFWSTTRAVSRSPMIKPHGNRHLNVDLMAAVRASWKVTPWMAAPAAERSSTSRRSPGWRRLGFPPAYCAAKAALVSHSKSLAVALAPQKIRVNTVAPGSIEFPGGLWEQAKQSNPDFYGAVLKTIPMGPDGHAGGGRRRRRVPGVRAGELGHGRVPRRRRRAAQGESVDDGAQSRVLPLHR